MGRWSVRVYGDPVGQGSMECKGQIRSGKSKGRHIVIPTNEPALRKWRGLVALAGRQLTVRHGVRGLTGPLGVTLTWTLPRPASVPLRVRAWPAVVNRADLDKLTRAVFDGLTESGVWADDALACELTARKVYPDTPGADDRLDRPGVVIRIYTLL